MNKVRLFAKVASLLVGISFLHAVVAKHTSDKRYSLIAAKVNEDIISTSDLEERLRLFILSMGGRISPEILVRAKSEILEEMIEEKLKWQFAQKFVSFAPHKTWVEESEVDREFDSIGARNKMSPSQFAKLLSSHGVSVGCVKNQIRHKRAWIKFVQAKYLNSVRISKEEVRHAKEEWEKHKNEPHYLVQRIFIPIKDFSSSAELEASQKISSINQLLSTGSTFEDVARQFSKGAEANRGGEIGWVFEGQMSNEEDKAIKQLKVGSHVTIKTNKGYVVLKLKNKRLNNADSYTQITFIQVVLPLGQGYTKSELSQFLNELKLRYKTTDSLVEAAKGKVPVSEKQSEILEDLPPEIRSKISHLKPGEVSDIIVNERCVFLVCITGRSTHSIKPPTELDFENRKIEEKLSNLSEREFKDVERRAVVVHYKNN